MGRHAVRFLPSGRTALVRDGATILDAAQAAGEPVAAECGGRGACGRCLVRVAGRESLACATRVHEPLTVETLGEAQLPRLIARESLAGVAPLECWAPFPLAHAPPVGGEFGVALDLGTTTLRLLVIRLADGVVVGEAGAYNPQIPRGADVISRIVAAEKGLLAELASSVRGAVVQMIGGAGPVAGYVVAGNLTMIHLLLGEDPSGIRCVPSAPRALAFEPVRASDLGWPGGDAPVYAVPAAGGWVGGDILAGAVRAGFSRAAATGLYVDLGTNGEIVLGGADFALACACSAGPAFEGVGIRCGMRADRGAIDGASIDERGRLELSVIGGGRARGVCGSGLIALAEALFHAGWIDRGGRLTDRLPAARRREGKWGWAVALAGDVALWERDLAGLIRAKAAVFAGIRTLVGALGPGHPIERAVVSGNFGRFLNLPAALGIGLLPELPLGRYGYVGNGSLEGAALALLSRPFFEEMVTYLSRVTYVDLADLPGYMDEFVGASFLPHTSEQALRL